MLADDARRQRHGTRTTFVRVFEIHVDAPPAALPARTDAGELRIVGTPAETDTAVAAVRAVAKLSASVPVSGFSLTDLAALAGSRAALTELCRRLRDAGLEAVGEVPLDSLTDTGLVEAARRGGVGVFRLTVHALPEDQRATVVATARDLQEAVGGFRAFAPLPRTMSEVLPTTGYDDVKQVAMARLMVSNIESIQVDWALYGPKLAQVALTMGADDVDGIAAVDPGILGIRRSPLEEILGNIRAASLEPFERNGLFESRSDR
jgi:aminodeoxyfutalosine synthase